MKQYPGLTPLLCFCTWLAVACLGVAVYAADGQGFLAQLLHGARGFERHYVNCHGADGKGIGRRAVDLPVRPANLTDCKWIFGWMWLIGELGECHLPRVRGVPWRVGLRDALVFAA